MPIQYLQSFIAGLLISLSGSLPLGNLNLAAMQIAAKETLRKALWFALGVTIVEMAYLRLTISAIHTLALHNKLFFIFRIISVVVLLIMAIGSFLAAGNKRGKNRIIDNKVKPLILGASMSAVNPMQVPFWLGWIVYLISLSLPVNTSPGSNIFTLSAGIGTFLALLIFILAGRKFSALMLKNKKIISIIMGCLFVIMAAFQITKLL